MGEMLDGLGIAETTPGPLIQVVQFVAFLGAFRHAGELPPLAAALFASVLVTWVTFVPCFLWIFLGAPYIERLEHSSALNAALTGVTAAVVGVILNLAVWFCLNALFGHVTEVRVWGIRLLVPAWGTLDLPALVIAAAFLSLFRWKAGLAPTLGRAALAGLLYRLALGPGADALPPAPLPRWALIPGLLASRCARRRSSSSDSSASRSSAPSRIPSAARNSRSEDNSASLPPPKGEQEPRNLWASRAAAAASPLCTASARARTPWDDCWTKRSTRRPRTPGGRSRASSARRPSRASAPVGAAGGSSRGELPAPSPAGWAHRAGVRASSSSATGLGR